MWFFKKVLRYGGITSKRIRTIDRLRVLIIEVVRSIKPLWVQPYVIRRVVYEILIKMGTLSLDDCPGLITFLSGSFQINILFSPMTVPFIGEVLELRTSLYIELSHPC